MLSREQQLSALAWKCEEVGISYGQMVTTYRSDEIAAVYKEYEKVLKEREKRKREAFKARQQEREHTLHPWKLDSEDRRF